MNCVNHQIINMEIHSITYHSTIQNVSYENKNEVLNTFGLCDDDDSTIVLAFVLYIN